MKKQNCATLFVARLSKRVIAENLVEVFSSFGHVFNARIIPQNSNQLSNYGFVEIDEAGAAKALQSVITLDNIRLIVLLSSGEPSEHSKCIEMKKQRRRFYEMKRKMTRKKRKDDSDDPEKPSSPLDE